MPAESKPKKHAVRPPSTEQLDRLVTVTSPVGWIALLALCIILVSILIWGFTGSIPTKIQGSGILIREGGIYDIVSTGAGQVSELLVAPGDLVQEHQVVARISQPELKTQVEAARRELNSLTREYDHLKKTLHKELKLQLKNFAKQKNTLRALLADLEKRESWLRKRERAQQELFAKGLLAEQTLINTRENIQSILEKKRRVFIQMTEIEEKRLQFKTQQEQELFRKELQVTEARDKLKSLQTELSFKSQVKSDHNGRILATMVRIGTEVNVGTPLLSLESLEHDLEAIVFVPAVQGKKVDVNMKIEICPTTVKRDAFGYIYGKVMKVTAYPATEQTMMSILGNEELVRELSRGGAPIAIHAELAKDPKTFSGFKWSSRNGPPFKITTGTICTADIVVREQAPITLVVPYLRGILGV